MLRSVVLITSLLLSAPAFSQTTLRDNLDITIDVINECSLQVISMGRQQHTALGDAKIVNGLGVRGGDAFIASVGLILVVCNKGVSYTLDIDQGMNYGMGPNGGKRALSDGQGNFISYDLWTDYSKSVEWMVGRGSNSGVTNETVELGFEATTYGKEWSVPADFWSLNMKPGGVYHDQNIVTLTYL